ncbi:MAG: nucleotidyl transferase AbiEii/AbiGii toxin family protein [Fibrobacterota bacterium]
MIKGLKVFQKHFGPLKDSFVIIGGTACSLVLESGNAEFRSTKDIDMVLHIEVLDQAFYESFKKFVANGGYSNIQKSRGKKVFYRFQEPKNKDYPEIVELFSRKPEAINLKLTQYITPIPAPEEVSDLSAILMKAEYYELIFSRKTEISGLPVAPAEILIPFKAHAWLVLTHLKTKGKDIKDEDIKKHKRDVFRLSQIIPKNQRIDLPDSVGQDLAEFLTETEKVPFSLKPFKIRRSFSDVIAGLRANYNLVA